MAISRTIKINTLGLFLLASFLAAGTVASAAERVVRPLNGKNLDGWKAKGPEQKSRWTVGLAKLDPANPRKLVVSPAGDAAGALINAGAHGLDIHTVEKFGDCTLRLEFMVPKGSNSGVYVMGEYEVQILDSFGREKMGPGDLGSIYGAAPPRMNASKAPGQWQQLEIVFQAPKFRDGEKVANARFIKVALNGQIVQANVEMQKQTPGGLVGREAPTGPLMFQGNHGEVAYRNIEIVLPE